MTHPHSGSRSRGTVSILVVVCAALVTAGLSSCTQGAELIVAASSPQLKREMGRLAADYQKTTGFRITPVDAPTSARSITVTIGWIFVPSKDDGKQVPLSKEKVQSAGFTTAMAFEQWCQGDAGWIQVPLLWDAWGVASPLGTGAVAALRDVKTFEWKNRDAFITARLALLCPGGESGVRQSLFWFADAPFPEGTLMGTLLGGADRTLPASLAYFKSFAAIGTDTVFSRGSFNLMKADVENLARSAGADLLFGNYQWLRGVQRPGGRDFRALIYSVPHGYAMPVSILGGRVAGSGSSAARAQDFLLWLLTPPNQKTLSNGTGYMAANFNAANLDLNGRGAREAAIGAVRIVPVDPQPLKGSAAESWSSLLGGILARPTDWEQVLAEKGGR
jgi:hypothetical protein